MRHLMILGALVASAAMIHGALRAGAAGESTIPIDNLSLVAETSTPEAQSALTADDEATSEVAVRVYPARAYPARAYPARAYPARVSPARVSPARAYPARAYPARIYYREGERDDADGALSSGVGLPAPDVSLTAEQG